MGVILHGKQKGDKFNVKLSKLKRLCTFTTVLCLLLCNIAAVSADGDTIASLWSGENQIDYYAPCTDTITLQIEPTKTFGDTNGIILKKLGMSVYYDTPTEIPVTVSDDNNKLNLTLSSPLEDSNRYELTLPDGFTDADGNNITPKKFNFKANASESTSEIKTEINFVGLTNDDLNTFGSKPAKGYIIGTDGLRFTKTASKTRNEIVSEPGCVGDTALKITERGVLVTDFADGTNRKSGKLKVDARFKVNSGSVNLKIGNSDATVTLLTAENDKTSLYSQDITGAEPTAFDAAAPENGYTTVSYEMNLTTMAVTEYTVNGETGTLSSGLLPRYNSNTNVLDTGFGLVGFESATASTEYLVDYIGYTVYASSPDVENISFTDVNSVNVAYNGTDAITPSVTEIKIKFNSAMDETTLENISVSGENGETAYTGTFDKSALTYSMYLPDYLKQNTVYTVTVPTSVKTVAGAGFAKDVAEDFKTGNGEFRILSLYFADSEGNKVTDVPTTADTLTLKVEILNTARLQKTIALVSTQNTNKLLAKLVWEDFEISGDNGKCTLTLENIDTQTGIDEINGFVWSDMQKHIPLHDYVTLR